MSGYPQFNIPLFDSEATRLRNEGVDVVSPAELDSEAVREESLASTDGVFGGSDKIAGETWGDMLARDVKLIADEVDGILVLPNWFESKGARLEVFVALLKGMPIKWAADMSDVTDAREKIYESLL